MSTNENETVTGQENVYGYFCITDKGEVSLAPSYRGDGNSEYSQSVGNGKKLPLPDVLVIPEQVGTTTVTSLALGMFYNNKRVKEISLPEGITKIPKWFCANATNLRAIHGTDKITELGYGAFGCTRIKEALFPSLNSLGEYAFTACGYLEVADIGTVSTISQFAFRNCAFLRKVLWKGNVVTICSSAFRNTRSLRELPLLAHANRVEDGAFFGSGISTALTTCGLFEAKAFPTFDNKTDFWTGVKFTPCCNRIATKLSQSNAEWRGDAFLDEYEDTKYGAACALFAVMHIHSAITGRCYTHPDDFVQELKENGLSDFLKIRTWPGNFDCVAPMFEAMGYRTEVRGMDSELRSEDYQAMVDALAQGAYIYAQVSDYNTWIDDNNPDGGHAVVIYGINELGEVCVLDSQVLHEDFREGGFEAYDNLYNYTIPYQNIAGPGSGFVIVYPEKGELLNVFTFDTSPSEMPVNVNAAVLAKGVLIDGKIVDKIGYSTAYNMYPGTFNVIETWQENGSSDRYVRYGENAMEWTPWNSIASDATNNNITSSKKPSELPEGVNVSMISVPIVDSDDAEYKKLPERKAGCLTAYCVFGDGSKVVEEWHPNESSQKYMRYAVDAENWSDWYVVPPVRYTR